MVSTLMPKQQRFVDEYLIDFNATKAAKELGYSEALRKLRHPSRSRKLRAFLEAPPTRE